MDAMAIRWGSPCSASCRCSNCRKRSTRYWEGAAAVTLAALNLNLLLALDERTQVEWRALLLPAALAALTFFISPAAGLGIYACWGLPALRRLGLIKAFQFVRARPRSHCWSCLGRSVTRRCSASPRSAAISGWR